MKFSFFATNKAQADEVINQVINDINRLEAKYSRYRVDSFLSTINHYATQGKSIAVDDETAGLLDYADTCYQQSDGLFDITSGKLRHAWQFDTDQIPNQAKINQLLTKIGWHKIQWQSPNLQFSLPGIEIDFGGIVKEYAVDRAASICLELGINSGVINLGGDIKILGPQPDGSPWKIGIRHPRKKNTLLQSIPLYEGAMASSGDYERFITVDGNRYGHVLNPKTGWPVKYMASVSVIADFCVIAGSASTIAMLKEEQGPDWLNELTLPHLWTNVFGEQGGIIPQQI